MRRAFAAALLLAVPLLAHAGSAQLHLASTGIIETPPRSAVTVVASIRNTGAERFTAGVEAELPEGWRRLIADAAAPLDPGASAVRIVSLFVPQEAQAGDYPVRIFAVDTATGSVLSEAVAVVRVLPYLELRVDGLDGSTLVVAGEEIELPFRVANRSNTPLAIQLELRSNTVYPSRIDGAPENSVYLLPGESRRLVARIRTPEAIGRAITYYVQVVAVGTTSDRSDEVRSSFRASTQVIPAVSEEPAPFVTIPARLGVTSANTFDDGWDGSIRTEFSGGGYLDSEARRRLDFLLSPSIGLPEFTLGSDRDVYRASYAGERIELLLGDHRFTVTPLLGTSYSGRGALARYTLGAFRFGALGFYPARVGPSASTVGATLDYSLPDASVSEGYRYRAAVSALSRPDEGVRISTRHEFRPDEETLLEAELALGAVPEGPIAPAAMVGATGTVATVDLSGTARVAMPGYPGPLGDRLFVSGAASAPIGEAGLRVTARSSFEQQNFLRSDALPSAARTVETGLGAVIPFADPAASVTAGVRYRTRSDVLEEPDFDRRAATVLSTVRFPLGALRLGVGTSHELERDALRDAWTFAHRYNLSATLTPDPGATYSATVGLQARSGTAVPGTTTTSLGMSATHRVGSIATTTRTSVGLSTNDAALSEITASLSNSTDHRFANAHVLTAAGVLRYAWRPSGGDFSGGLTVGYTLPLRIPVARQRGVGGAEGLVYDSITGDPAANVVIRLADRAVVSGPTGRFQFSALAPGEYHVQVDASRYALSVIPDLPTPMMATIAADEMSLLDIPVVRGAAVSGTVRLYATRDDEEGLLQRALVTGNGEYQIEDLVPAGGLARVVVELRNGSEFRRVLTDRDGRFSFADVRPGTWRVVLATSQIPRFHRVLDGESEVLLTPGARATAEFDVLPVRRPVTLLPSVTAPLSISVPTSVEAIRAAESERGPDVRPSGTGPPIEPPADPPVAAGPAPSDRLLAMAIERYAWVDPAAPRLLVLPWGTDAAGARAALGQWVTPLATGPEPADDPYLTAFQTHGDLMLGLESAATLTFLDPLTDGSELFLVGASVRADARAGGLSGARAEAAFADLVDLWLTRWRPARVDEGSVDGVRVVRAEIRGVLITFRFDRASGIIVVEYRDLWHQEAIRSVLAEDGEP